MAEALIYVAGGSVDTDSLTAAKEDVVSGKKFYGAGSEEIQEGSMANRGTLNKILGINETYVAPEGFYEGGKVSQNIPVLGAQRISPTSKTQTISTQGCYMGGDIIVNPIANLVPENIKKGEYVGGVGPGTWEGYLNDDPNRFFWHGTFAPGQGITAIKYQSNSTPVLPQVDKKSIYFLPEDDSRYKPVFYFNLPIDITTKSKLIIKGEYKNSGYLEWSGYPMKAGSVSWREMESQSTSYNRVFHNNWRNNTTGTGVFPYTVEFDLSSYSREIYLYVYSSVANDNYLTIESVQFT